VARNNIVIVAFVFMLLVSTASAVEPILWREHTQAQFAGGEPNGVSFTRDGVVALSPSLVEVADVGEEFVWDLARDQKGRLLIATGNRGKVYRFTEGEKPRLLLDTPEVAMFSIAVSQNGTVFTGSSPDGLIYRLRPGKEVETFCRTEDEHVWALLVDRGVLYAATGGKVGRVLKISDDGSVTELFKSPDPNIVCLVRGPDGSLYAGSDQSGFVYRLKTGGKLEVLYDAPESEVRALAIGKSGLIYAAAMSGKSTANAQREGAKPQQGNGTAVSSETSSLYAIRPSGATVRLWEAPDPMLLSIHVGETGELTALTGETGGVYRIKADGSATLLTKLQNAQPWTFAASPAGEIWLGMAGSGKVYKLGKSIEKEGTLTSKPRDFSLVSRWGKLAWKADTPPATSVVFQTRSGNSETPDDTWSGWSGPMTTAGQIQSPPGRFIQYRAQFKSTDGTTSPRLKEVTLAGLQENVSPQILTVGVTPPAGHKNGLPKTNDNATVRHNGTEGGNGIWQIKWAAGDANNDRLIYDLYFRGRDEKQWKLLGDDLTKTSFQWDVESAPEGTMQVKVVASDRLSNPAVMALETEKESEPFDLDHTSPVVNLQVTAEGSGTLAVTGKIKDLTSPIQQAAYAINSGKWQVVFPLDDIFDSRIESLNFKITGLKSGEYSIVVRASDTLGNMGVGKVVAEVEGQ